MLLLAKAFRPEPDFGARIFLLCIVKILANPSGFAAFLPQTPKKIRKLQNSTTPKEQNFVRFFGAEDAVRLSPYKDEKPKSA